MNTAIKPTKEEIISNLNQFTGTVNYYKHWLGRYVYTDGIRYLAQSAGAYWLIDEIVFSQKLGAIKNDRMLQEIQFWKYKVDTEKHTGILTCERDTGNIAFTKKFDYTDFPLESIKLYFSGGVLFLPSEY